MHIRTRLVLATLATFVAIVVYMHATSGPLQILPAGTSMYASKDYGYSFTYPSAYRANEYSPHLVTLSDPLRAMNADLVRITVELADDESARSYESFVHEEAARYCYAEGYAGSQECTGITRSETFTTRANLHGEFFYLRLVTTVDGAVSAREVGPFWAFNISPNASESTHAALLVFPVHFLIIDSAEYVTGTTLAQMLVGSLQIEKASR